jgi:hypothetical protein
MKMLFALLVIAPVVAPAADPLDGTWRFNLQSAQFGTKPEKFELADGIYKCFTCDPPLSIKADGQDQPYVSPYTDTVSVRIVDPNTIELVHKKGGKVVASGKYTVSVDGKTATDEFTRKAEGSDQPVTGSVQFVRVTNGPAGSHAVSGSWRAEKAGSFSENALTTTYKTTADGLSMTQPSGESFTAKFDGKDYPYKGDPGITAVSLKRINANTIEETAKRNGKAISRTRLTVSPDGRTLTAISHDLSTKDTESYTAQKQ